MEIFYNIVDISALNTFISQHTRPCWETRQQIEARSTNRVGKRVGWTSGQKYETEFSFSLSEFT